MKQTIILTNEQKSELEQIFNELVYSLKKTYSEEDLVGLCYQILKESGSQTYNSKKDTTINLFKSIGKYSGKAYLATKDKAQKYKKNGILFSLAIDSAKLNGTIIKLPDSIIELTIKTKDKAVLLNKNFLQKPKEEKIEIISVGIMGVLIFFASAGGEDLEGGIPDSDLKLGVGLHRHFLSHSIIMGFFVEMSMRSGIEVLNKSYKNLPKEHHKFWDITNGYINKHKGVAIGAMWAGIGAHLLKDSGIFGHGVKPYVGIPTELPLEAHQSLFAANGAASAAFAYKDARNKN